MVYGLVNGEYEFNAIQIKETEVNLNVNYFK